MELGGHSLAGRGVRDVRLLPLVEVDERLGTFGTVLMMCGNFGLAGNAGECARTLRTLHRITQRAAGRMPGQVTIRLRHQGRVTPGSIC